MGKVGKAGKAVVMKKTNQLMLVKDSYVMPPGPGELLIHNVYTSVNPVDCYMRSGLIKVQFFPKVRDRVWRRQDCQSEAAAVLTRL